MNQALDLVFKAIQKKMMMINWSEPCSPFFKAIGEEMMVERKKNLGHTLLSFSHCDKRGGWELWDETRVTGVGQALHYLKLELDLSFQ